MDGVAINNSTAMRHFAKYACFCPPSSVVCIMGETSDLREPVTCEVNSINSALGVQYMHCLFSICNRVAGFLLLWQEWEPENEKVLEMTSFQDFFLQVSKIFILLHSSGFT